MKNEFWTTVENAYFQARQLESVAMRDYLRAAYPDRPEVWAEVESLVAADVDGITLLDSNTVRRLASEMLKDEDNLIGRVIAAKYRVRECIATTAMSEVYLVDHVALDTPFVLKRPTPNLRRDDNYRQRFLEEARRAVILRHENVARVHDVLDDGTDMFVVMEHIDGDTLRARLEKLGRPLQTNEFLPIAIQAASALAAAHEKRVVHLDVKPANIMLTKTDQVKICDFGIARRLSVGAEEDTTHDVPQWQFAGTPAYMAPEVILTYQFDERADLFSLGIVFYEMLAGYNPFLADTPLGSSTRIVSENPGPISAINRNVDPDIERLVFSMLAKEPDDRLKSANEAVDRLRAIERSMNRSRFLRILVKHSHRRGVKALFATLIVSILVAASISLERSNAPAVDRPRPTSVLISDFKNTSGDNALDLTIREMFLEGVGRSQQVRLFPDPRIADSLKRMRREPEGALEESVAREICIRENIDVLVTGEVSSSGSGLLLTARLVSANANIPEQSFAEAFSGESEVSSAAARLLARIREALGETKQEIQQTSGPLDQATTANLVALQRFSLARRLRATGKHDDARLVLQTAIQLDPEFALAYSYLGNTQMTLGMADEALDSITKAYNLRDRVSERERLKILALYHYYRTEYEAAVEDYKTLTLLYPGESDALQLLSQLYAILEQPAEAIDSIKRAIAISSTPIAEGLLLGYYNEGNQFDEALSAAAAAHTKHPDDPYIYWNEGMAWLGKGDAPRAQQAFKALASGGGVYSGAAHLNSIEAMIYEGRLNEAAFELEQDLKSPTVVRESLTRKRRYWLARINILRARRAEALQQLDILDDKAQMPLYLYQLRDAGRMYAEMGETRLLDDVIHQLDVLQSRYPGQMTQAAAFHIRGERELALGRFENARVLLERAQSLHADTPIFWSLARAWKAQSRHDRAAEYYNAVIGRKGLILNQDFSGIWVLAHLELARCLAARGEYAAAKTYYDEFLKLWGGRQLNVPVVLEAEKERQALR